jgi:hypothetical protein
MRTLACLLVVACGGTKPPAESPPSASSSLLDCGKVAAHVATAVAADKPRPGVTPAAIKELVGTRCQADAWSDETKQCLNAIATIQDGRACAAKMTDEQRAALKTQATALRKDASVQTDADDHSSDWIRHVVEEPGTKTR